MEIWKDIENYENLYEVSNEGRIRRKGRKILKQNLKRNGYLTVDLSKNNIVKTISVHRIVAKAFIPNPENKSDVNHKNGRKIDNRLENLEWTTSSENRKHAFDTGLQNVNCLKKKVRCKQLNIEFESSYAAAEFLNTKYFQNTKQIKTIAAKIRTAALGIQKNAYGFTWEQVI